MRYSSLVRSNCCAFSGKTEKRFCSVLFKNNSSAREFQGVVLGGFSLECRDFLTALGFVPKMPFTSDLSTEFVKVLS